MILFASEFLVIGKGTVDVEKRGDLEFLIISGVPMYFATILNMFEGNAMILNLYAEADKPQHF